MIIDFKKLFHTTVVFLVCYFKLLFLFVFSFVGCEQSYIKADKNVDPNNSIYVQDNGLETTITDKDVSADFLKVRYASNEESAAFECYYVFYKDENELSKLSSDNDRFSICSSNGIEVPRQSGKNLLFKVRAILAGGLKDITPARITIPSSQSDNGGDDGDEDTPELLDLSPFSVNITNKTSIVDISAGDSKVFYLQVTKNNQTSPETAQFQIYCKTKESADFILCEERDRYTFKNLKADTNYSLWIEAVHVSSGRQLLVRDVVNFVAKNSTVTPPPPPPTTPPVEPPTPGIPPTPPPVGGGEELVVPRT
ncbi:MAG: hypothetical protein KBD78_16730, partial [Oligoflexales bacterium]|nr:hypothetical protein [Oligoflexales bacterium]